MALMLAACGKPAPIESVESLVANPERLKELRAACKADTPRWAMPRQRGGRGDAPASCGRRPRRMRTTVSHRRRPHRHRRRRTVHRERRLGHRPLPDVFSRYIDSGFGLLGGEVAFLTATLVAIDMTLAGLFWAMGHASGQGDDVMAKLIKKVLYVGAFAYILGNFNRLAGIVFNSFAGLGLTASGSGLSQAQLLQPGRLAQVGIDAGRPIMVQISDLTGFGGVRQLDVIAVLFLAWLVLIVCFFVLAVQLFVTLIEFKLTTLAALRWCPSRCGTRPRSWPRRSWAMWCPRASRCWVLAVIVGIGTGLFSEFTVAPCDPSIDYALVIMLAALHAGPGDLRAGDRDRAGVRRTAARRRGRCWDGHRGSGTRCGRWCRRGRRGLRRRCGGPHGARGGARGHRWRCSSCALGIRAGQRRQGRLPGRRCRIRRGGGSRSRCWRCPCREGRRRCCGAAHRFRCEGGQGPRSQLRGRCGGAGVRFRIQWRRRRLAGFASEPAWRSACAQAAGDPCGYDHRAVSARDHGGRTAPACAMTQFLKGIHAFQTTLVWYSDSPAPATPYQAAAQAWDERIGSARVQVGTGGSWPSAPCRSRC